MSANVAEPVLADGDRARPSLQSFGLDILGEVLSNVNAQELAHFACACSALNAASRPFLWRLLVQELFSGLDDVRHAVTIEVR